MKEDSPSSRLQQAIKQSIENNPGAAPRLIVKDVLDNNKPTVQKWLRDTITRRIQTELRILPDPAQYVFFFRDLDRPLNVPGWKKPPILRGLTGKRMLECADAFDHGMAPRKSRRAIVLRAIAEQMPPDMTYGEFRELTEREQPMISNSKPAGRFKTSQLPG